MTEYNLLDRLNSTRLFLDDINQSYVTIHLDTNLISANSYIRDLDVGDAISCVLEYWYLNNILRGLVC